MKKLIFISFLSFHFSHFSVGQTRLSQKEWVDSVYDCMSLEQKIGQLFMVAAYSNKNEHHFRHLDSLITHCHLGGLIFFQGGPLRQAKLTNRYQALAKIPLWIGMDAEWGLGMRLDSTLSFPKQMTLGALQDNSLIYKMGKQLAYQCRRLGVHISFSPVMDVNSNPDNPVIGVRSFGEDKEKVAMKGIAYMRGLQDNKVLACAKHFPGHGDTDTDSHLSLPIIKQDKKRIESLELYPFKRLIKDSIGSIMIAHINTPAYEEEENLAATLSHNIVNDLLKEKLDFEGVIFTDALNMKAVSKFYKPGEVDLLAFKAGNDVLLFSENVPKAVNLIKEAIEEKKNLRKELEKKVRKILMSKYWLKLYEKQHVKIDSLYEDLNNGNAHALRVKMYEEAFTIVQNKESLLPLKNGKSNQLASVAIGLDKENVFQKTLSKYAEFKNYVVDKKAMPDFDYRSLLDSLSKCNIVVVSLHELHNQRSKNYNISQNTIEFVQNLASKTKVVLVVMGN
ncbi:MAG TPA: glycosyl hydrolase, partial [Cytophagales bacterium]|nr:glycosyl hydrolase [Cytophagales bacterium]